jgi:hypothetical protein
MRPNGFLVLVGLVVLGLGSGAAYFHYKQPKLAAEMQAQIEAAPKTPRGKLEQWHVIGAPQIHHRLSQFALFDPPERPWLVTYAVGAGDGPPELWGIDCGALPRELSHLEDMTVVIELPTPTLLGHGSLADDQFNFIPLYPEGEPTPDQAARLRDLALYLLAGIPDALGNDIEGASLEIRITD